MRERVRVRVAIIAVKKRSRTLIQGSSTAYLCWSSNRSNASELLRAWVLWLQRRCCCCSPAPATQLAGHTHDVVSVDQLISCNAHLTVSDPKIVHQQCERALELAPLCALTRVARAGVLLRTTTAHGGKIE